MLNVCAMQVVTGVLDPVAASGRKMHLFYMNFLASCLSLFPGSVANNHFLQHASVEWWASPILHLLRETCLVTRRSDNVCGSEVCIAMVSHAGTDGHHSLLQGFSTAIFV